MLTQIKKNKSFGQFLIWIRIHDSYPDSNSDSNLDPDPKLTSGRIRSETGSETFVSDPQHWIKCLNRYQRFFFIFYVLYSTLLHLSPLRFHCVGGFWDRTQDCCDFGINSQTLKALGQISSTMRMLLVQAGKMPGDFTVATVHNCLQMESKKRIGEIFFVIHNFQGPLVLCEHSI